MKFIYWFYVIAALFCSIIAWVVLTSVSTKVGSPLPVMVRLKVIAVLDISVWGLPLLLQYFDCREEAKRKVSGFEVIKDERGK